MGSKYFLSLDAGTGSGRAVLFDEFGNQKAIRQKEWHHIGEPNIEGSMGFDFVSNWNIICECIRSVIYEAKIDANDIKAVSSSSMREGIVLYDSNGCELWAVANVDSRSGDEVAWLKKSYPDLEEKIYAKSGQTFALSAIPRLLWLKNKQPRLYDNVSKISMISDWILYKLSGSLVSEPSNAATAGIFDLLSRRWDSSFMSIVGLKADILPDCAESGEVIGTVSNVASKHTGLSTITKVVLGGGDVQIGCVGLGVVNEGEGAILGGSFWQQVVNVKSSIPPTDMSVRLNPHCSNGLYQAEAISFFTGLIMRWFRDAFCDKEKEVAIRDAVDVYDILESMASEVPAGSYGVMPIFSDVMRYGKWYHAAPSFINLSIEPSRCNKAVLFRALEENAAIVSAINLANIEEFSGVKLDSIVFAAGASKGKLWPQIVADVTRKEVRVPLVKEATSLGCAMFAAVSTGHFADINEAAKSIVKIEKVFTPNKETFKIYDELKCKWSEIYNSQLSLVDRGLTNSMWKAPGI